MGFDGISDIFKRVRQKFPVLSQRIEEAEALSRWQVAVGPQISKHTRPIQVLDGVLWVEVDHPVWKSELHHRKRQILAQLNRKLEEPTQSGAKVVLQDILFLDPRPGFSGPSGFNRGSVRPK